MVPWSLGLRDAWTSDGLSGIRTVVFLLQRQLGRVLLWWRAWCTARRILPPQPTLVKSHLQLHHAQRCWQVPQWSPATVCRQSDVAAWFSEADSSVLFHIILAENVAIDADAPVGAFDYRRRRSTMRTLINVRSSLLRTIWSTGIGEDVHIQVKGERGVTSSPAVESPALELVRHWQWDIDQSGGSWKAFFQWSVPSGPHQRSDTALEPSARGQRWKTWAVSPQMLSLLGWIRIDLWIM